MKEKLASLSDRQFLLACAAATVLLRLPFLDMPFGNDEGGYAYVATHWDSGDGGIYGGQWVDRPPLLFALYAIGLALAGDLGIRLIGCLAAVVVVLTCADAARRIRGPVAMRWAGPIATVLASSTVFQAHTVNAELPAIAFTSATVWFLVRALTESARGCQLLWSLAAGTAASSALMVKQSFADGFAFIGLALLACWAMERRSFTATVHRGRAALRCGIAAATGAAAVLGAVAVWAVAWGPGITPLLDALYGFRIEAREVIGAAPEQPTDRAYFLVLLSVVTGVLALLAFVTVGLAKDATRTLREPRVSNPSTQGDALAGTAATGLLGMGALGVIAVTFGGNWWMHYLIQLVPFLAIGTGMTIAAREGRLQARLVRLSRQVGRVAIATMICAWAVTAAWTSAEDGGEASAAVGDWLSDAARPDDTALVAWGSPDILYRSGLRNPYEHSWSLPVRVRDPKLKELRRVVAGRRAPTWIVELGEFDTWRLDANGKLRRLVERRYERVGVICGREVHRLRGATRPEPPRPTGEDCYAEPLIEVFGNGIP